MFARFIKVNNKNEEKEIFEILEKLGCQWGSGDKMKKFSPFEYDTSLKKYFLIIKEDKKIMWQYVKSPAFKQITLDDLKKNLCKYNQ